jgi:hypothetical protein
VGYGNYGTTSGSFHGTTGLGENVAVDLAAYGINQADGWGTDLVTGQQTFTRHDSVLARSCCGFPLTARESSLLLTTTGDATRMD